MKSLPFLVLFVLFLSGCGEEEILHYKVPKEKSKDTSTAVSPKVESTAGSKAASHNGIAWTLPENWTFAAGSGMRFGTFKFTHDNTPIECTLVRLGGAAGGLAPNINRWRGQIGLDPASEADILKSLETVKGKMGEIKISKLVNPDKADSAILASIISTQKATIFLKITTKSNYLDSLKNEFSKFSASVHLTE
jgi:hypothetical protein